MLPANSFALRRSAFTLIELLLVIGIIAILASVVIVAINPRRQLSATRDVQRRSDVKVILDAVYQYTVDHNVMPAGIPVGETEALEICKVSAADCTGYVNLRMLSGAYLTSIPVDPQAPASETGTNYVIYREQNGRLTVTAINAEQGAIIVTR